MAKDVIAVFDVGKTNKKILLFDDTLSLVHQEEKRTEEIIDDDGFPCDDIEQLEQWMKDALQKAGRAYNLRAVNFTTYGATLMYLDDNGRRLTPVYNYLKPMPEGVLDGFYESWGGADEFCRRTASPALGMLNSGLQALWLKKKKPEVFGQAKTILHLPQYLSYCFTGKKVSEYTSIGCHTAMWDFDNMTYHPWLRAEGIRLPEPVSNDTTYEGFTDGHRLTFGIGIHDSSASLVPYFRGSPEPFILVSTGTWCIFMNPFNDEPLTAEQLKKDSLCYMSINQKQVKSSRLFLGHIHDVNAKRLAEHFNMRENSYKKVTINVPLLKDMASEGRTGRLFFRQAIPSDFVDHSVDLARFASYEVAYHRLVFDLVSLGMDSLRLVIPAADTTRTVYISGGFARNEIFVRLLATRLPDKAVYTSEIDNATALGAAMVIWEKAFGKELPSVNLGLKLCLPLSHE